MKGDLHVHSTLSDCNLTRDEVLCLAVQNKVTHLAFTEHDTTLQSDQLSILEERYPVTLFKGVELSAEDPETGKKAHILSYNYRTTNHMESLVASTTEQRCQKGLRYVAILQEQGYDISVEQVGQYSASSVLYQQHVMRHLFETKQVAAMFGAEYKKIFGKGGPCSLPICYPSAEDTVRAIVADGGIPVLAHAGQQQNFTVIDKLVPLGLQAVEYRHPSHSQKDRDLLQEYAKKYHLYLSGGSDFHGMYTQSDSTIGDYFSDLEFIAYLEATK